MENDARGIKALRETYDRAAPGVLVYGGHEPYHLAEHVAAIP